MGQTLFDQALQQIVESSAAAGNAPSNGELVALAQAESLSRLAAVLERDDAEHLPRVVGKALLDRTTRQAERIAELERRMDLAMQLAENHASQLEIVQDGVNALLRPKPEQDPPVADPLANVDKGTLAEMQLVLEELLRRNRESDSLAHLIPPLDQWYRHAIAWMVDETGHQCWIICGWDRGKWYHRMDRATDVVIALPPGVSPGDTLRMRPQGR